MINKEQERILKAKNKIIFKSEKGSITVFALSVMLFLITVLILSYIGISNKASISGKKVNQIYNEYMTTDDKMDEEYIKNENKDKIYISYNANGGSNAPERQEKTKGKDIELSSKIPTRTGYKFKGWTTQKDSTVIEYNPSDIYSKDETLILYAIWEENIYEVNLDQQFYTVNFVGLKEYSGNDNEKGEVLKTEKVPAGGVATAPDIETRFYYSMISICQFMEWDTDFTNVQSNLVVYAKYNKYTMGGQPLGECNYSITPTSIITYANTETIYEKYNIGIYKDSSCKQQITNYQNKVNVPRVPGYSFAGYYTGKNGTGTKMLDENGYLTNNFNSSYFSNNGTLYAKWIKENQPHTVTYNYEENKGNSVSIQSAEINEGEKINLEVSATKTNYDFVGWNTDPDATEGLKSLVMGSEDVTLYAIYSKTVTATCYYYSGTAQTSKKVSGTMYNKSTTASVNLGTTSLTGYTFRGWSTSNSGNATISVASNGSVGLSSNATYYACYSYTVTGTYKYYNGTEYVSSTATATAYMNSSGTKIGGKPTAPTVSNPSGWTARGWSKATEANTSSILIPGTITENETYYYSWKKTVNIYYTYANGTNETSSTSGTNYLNYEGTPILAKFTIIAAPTRDEYTFVNWNTSSDGTGTGYVPGQELSFADGNIYLTAYWKKITYKLKWYGNRVTSLEPTMTAASMTSDESSNYVNNMYQRNNNDIVFIASATGMSLGVTNGIYSMTYDKLIKNATYTIRIKSSEDLSNWKIYLNDTEINGIWEEIGTSERKLTFVNTVVNNTSGTLKFETYSHWSFGGSRGFTNAKTLTVGPLQGNSSSEYTHVSAGYTSGYTISYGSSFPSILTSVTQAKTGYTFKGWNTSSDGTGEWVSLSGTYSWKQDISLYAIWNENTYKIQLDNNVTTHQVTFVALPQKSKMPDKEVTGVIVRTVQVAEGGNAIAPDILKTHTTEEGCTFDFKEWDKSFTNIQSDIVVNATYYFSGPTGGSSTYTVKTSDSVDSNYIYEKYNTGIYLDSNYTKQMTSNDNKVSTPIRADYSFMGYYTGKNGTGLKMIDENGYVTADFKNTYFTEDSTLYALFGKISFNANGGTFVRPKNGTVDLSSTVTLAESTGVLEYAWSTSKTTTPTQWKSMDNGSTVLNIGCTANDYYLWVRVLSDDKTKVLMTAKSAAFKVYDVKLESGPEKTEYKESEEVNYDGITILLYNSQSNKAVDGKDYITNYAVNENNTENIRYTYTVKYNDDYSWDIVTYKDEWYGTAYYDWYYYRNHENLKGEYDLVYAGQTGTYKFDSNGKMMIGWEEDSDGKWYYYYEFLYRSNIPVCKNTDQIEAAGNLRGCKLRNIWANIGYASTADTWYYFDENGVMATGWTKVDGYLYYCNTSGAMQTGWQNIDGSWYYLKVYHDGTSWSGPPGSMLCNTSATLNGKTYNFNANGVCTNP